MSSSESARSGWARARRAVLVLLAVVAVAGPIPVGLVLAWQASWWLVVPAYLLGIPAWLCLVSAAWSLVRRVVPAAQPEPQASLPGITTELRLPSPRTEGTAAPAVVRTPTP